MQVELNDIIKVRLGYLDRVVPIDRILTVITALREQRLSFSSRCFYFEQVFDLLILPCRLVFTKIKLSVE